MDRSDRPDRDTRSLVSRREVLRDRYARDRESGQAAMEFALILVPMLILIGGIIYFGIGLNYWLDMNRVANQGARWAAVNNWPPQCDRGSSSCSAVKASCNGANGYLADNSQGSLQNILRCSTRNTATCVAVSYPGVAIPSNATVGDPVKVTLTAPYKFWFVRSVGITLTASATMRLEQKPSLIGVSSC
jgi:Flp pilus assembly protein TadG